MSWVDTRFSTTRFQDAASSWLNCEKVLTELRAAFGDHDVATSTPNGATCKDFRYAVDQWSTDFWPCLPEALALAFIAMREKELRSLREIRELHEELDRDFERLISMRHDFKSRGLDAHEGTNEYWNCNPCRSRVVHLALLSQSDLEHYDQSTAEEREVYWAATPLFGEVECGYQRIACSWPAYSA
ncbi:unnamed protein product [Peniophora sp. CBMAI 1063]|nr:unnamed protein product [Peniophora sp. CBMAI 1063]